MYIKIKIQWITNLFLFFLSFGVCLGFSNFAIYNQIKVSKLSGNHAATWWQKLATDFPSLGSKMSHSKSNPSFSFICFDEIQKN
jgi:hypothetical protein